MEKFRVIIDSDALQDIQEATDWYNLQVEGIRFKISKTGQVSN